MGNLCKISDKLLVVLLVEGVVGVSKSSERGSDVAFILCSSLYPHYIDYVKMRLTIVVNILDNSKSYEKNLRGYTGFKLFALFPYYRRQAMQRQSTRF